MIWKKVHVKKMALERRFEIEGRGPSRSRSRQSEARLIDALK